jgi:putative DNA primase/helicase
MKPRTSRFKRRSRRGSEYGRNNLLDKLYQRCAEGYLELRAIIEGNDDAKRKFLPLRDGWLINRKLIDGFCNKFGGRNIYFGVATRDGQGGKKQNVKDIPTVWADIDYKDIPAKEFKGKLEKFPFPPSVIINSGNGQHLYWILESPTQDGEQIEKINEWIMNELGGDKQATEFARVMRLPDTTNHKYEDQPLCKVIENNSNIYTFEELFERVPKKKKRFRRKSQPATGLGEDILEKQIAYIVDEIKKTGKIIYSEEENYAEWRNIGFALADALGEKGRQYFHTISEVDENEYDNKTTDNQFDKCLASNEKRGNKPKFKIGYFINLAKENGIRIHKGLRNDRRYKKKKCVFEPLLEARIFKEDDDKRFIVYAKQLLQYHDGYYQAFKDEYYLKMIEGQIEYVHDGRVQKAEEILKVLKHQHHEKTEIEVNPNPKLINCKNGILNIDTDTPELLPHTPDIFFDYQIPIRWNENAKCKEWKNFLKQVLVTEEDLKPDIQLIRIIKRFAGYCLYSKVPFHESLLFLGEGSNGKGTLCRVLTELLGKELTSTVDFGKIAKDSFAASHLVGKRLNISFDFSTSKLSDGDIKAIIGGDSIFVQRKNERGFDYAPDAKHIMCLNELPYSNDKSYGFFRRINIIPFHMKFIPKVEMKNIDCEEEKDLCVLRDAHIENKLKTEQELEGIFCWAVDGLKRLLEKDEFPYSSQVAKLKDMFKVRCSTVESFIEICTERDHRENELKESLYRAYLKYCNEVPVPSDSYIRFGQGLRNKGFALDTGGGNGKARVRGIALKDEYRNDNG